MIPYSPTRRAGELVFVSGQLGWQDGQLADGFAAQCRLSLSNLDRALAAEGGTLADVVQWTVYLADVDDWAGLNEVLTERLSPPYPARTAVGAGLGPGVLVEIDAVAHVR